MSTIRINDKDFELGFRTYVMGILNVTPDSFSDGGHFDVLENAVEHALFMEGQGADFIDVGGESTRPSAKLVAIDEELKRVVPAVEALSKRLRVPISIDTYKAEVAHQCILKGAGIINDVWGLQKDPFMADVAAQHGVPLIMMHNQMHSDYEGDLIESIKFYFEDSIEIALKAGVKQNKLILDPGIGFGKTFEHNVEVMRRLKELKSLGFPLLLGTSRKSFIAKILNLPPEQRVNGTVATTVMAVESGYDIVRVHDVKENLEAARIADYIYRV